MPPRIKTTRTTPSSSSASQQKIVSSLPTSSLDATVLVIHLSVAKKLAAGRTYTGVPPLGPLALPYYISHIILDDSPGLPLEIRPDELYATVGGELKKIRLVTNCEEGRTWKKTAERFQSGNKQGTSRPATRIKMEEVDEDELDEESPTADPEDYGGIKLKRKYGSLRGAGTSLNPLVLLDSSAVVDSDNLEVSDLPRETKKKKVYSPEVSDLPREMKKKKVYSSEVSDLPREMKKKKVYSSEVSDLPREMKKKKVYSDDLEVSDLYREAKKKNVYSDNNLVLPDLTPDEVKSRRVKATLKNEALKRGLGLKSLSSHDTTLRQENNMVDKQTQTQALTTPPTSMRKIAEFTARLVALIKILHKAIEVLPESYLAQIEAYFEVDWMVEDIETAVKGAISRKHLADAKRGVGGKSSGYKCLFTVDKPPSGSSNQKITEFVERLMSLVKALYQAIEVLSEPYFMELERLFDVDWMIEDIGGAVNGAISCKNLNGGARESC